MMKIDSIMAPSGMPAADAMAGNGTADQLEQAFLEEMLKYCGPGAAEGAFSGGAGEEQFSSFLTREHAAILSRRMDLGFAGLIGARA